MNTFWSYLTPSMLSYSVKPRSSQQQGFTLLEMVLVLFLIGLLASAGLLFTEGVEDQAKYDETKRRMELIRKAIVGDHTRTINGAPEISGFATDMGRLPECLAELIFPRNCADDDDLPDWNYDADSGIWLGWRGPYLNTLNDRDGISRFRDGYGNIDPDPLEDDQNYGWEYSLDDATGQVILASVGFHIYVPEDDIISEIVSFNDYAVTLAEEWKKLPVVFNNILQPKDSTEFINIPTDSLRIRLNYPADGELISWSDGSLDSLPKRDVSAFLSETFPAFSLTLIDNGNIKLPFEDGVSKEIYFSSPITKTGNEITLSPGTIITYREPAPSLEALYQFQVSPFCKPDCRFVIEGIVETADENYSVLTTNSLVDSSLSAPSSMLMILVDNLVKAKLIVPIGSSVSTGTLTLPNGATVSLPANSSDIFENQIVLGGSSITVSESFTLNNNAVTTSLTGDVFAVPSGTVRGMGNDLSVPATLSLTMGQRSLTVVCEIDGEVFTGDCASPPEASTNRSFITLSPRNTVPSPPEPLIWSIK